MFVVFVACIEFSGADVLSQLGNRVCQWHPSDDCIADSCRNLNPDCLGNGSVSVISIGPTVPLVSLQRWYLKAFL